MFEEYRNKVRSFLKTPGNGMGRFVFTSLDIGISLEVILATICTAIGLFLSRHHETVSSVLYGTAFVLLAWELVAGIIGDVANRRFYFRYILLTAACLMAMFSGMPLAGLLSVLLIRVGNIVISSILLFVLKKCGDEKPYEFNHVKWKSSSESRLGNYLMRANAMLPLLGVSILVIMFIVFLVDKDFFVGGFFGMGAVALFLSASVAYVLYQPLIFRAFQSVARKCGTEIGDYDTYLKLKNIKSIVLGKTGLLMNDEYVIYSIVSDSYPEEAILEMTAYAEYYSRHPVAAAVFRRYEGRINESLINDFKEYPGRGVESQIGDSTVLVGSEAFMRERDIPITQKISNSSNDRLLIYVAMDDEEVGCIQLVYRRNKMAKQLVKQLKSGANVSVITAADTRMVSDLCDFFGIEDYHAEVLDEESQKIIDIKRNEIKNNGIVAYMTHGVNRIGFTGLCDLSILYNGEGCSSRDKERFDVCFDTDDMIKVITFFNALKKCRMRWRFLLIGSAAIRMVLFILAVAGVINLAIAVAVELLFTIFALLFIGRLSSIEESKAM